MDRNGMGSVGEVPPSGRHEDFVEQLCRAHEAQLLLYLTRMLGHADLAREVAQDTYEKLHKMYRPDEVMFPRAMLFKTATNFALMRLRRARLENSIITGSAGMGEGPDEAAPPERCAIADEINEPLPPMLQELEANPRQI